MDNELIAFLRDDDTRFVSSRLIELQNSKINTDMSSDFDVFNSFCEGLYLIAGHSVRNKLVTLLSRHTSLENSDVLYDCEYRKMLWKKVFSNSEITLPCADSFDAIELTTPLKVENVFNINFEIDVSCESIFDLLDKSLSKIKRENATTVLLDMRGVSYARPDDFHAQKAFDDLRNGSTDCSLVMLWLLCRILMNTGLELRLIAKDIDVIGKILNLIFRLGLSPKITICIDCACLAERESFDNFYELFKQYCKKNISLELCCSKENIDVLIKFLKAVPLAFVNRLCMPVEAIKTAFCSVATEQEIDLIISCLYRAE